MKKILFVPLAAALFAACGPENVSYRPAPQILPSNIKRIAIRQVENKTQQFGLEDKLTLRIRDEFLRDGRYPLTPVEEASGVVLLSITRYILVPIQYDATLNPTSYKLQIAVDVQLLDHSSNQVLWDEKNLDGVLVYPAATLAGGLTEEQAREQIYPIIAAKVVKRVIDGFGAASGASQRRLSGQTTTAPQPDLPTNPVNPNPY